MLDYGIPLEGLRPHRSNMVKSQFCVDISWRGLLHPTPQKKGGETSVVSSPGITTLFSRLCLANYPLFFSGFLEVWLALVYSCPCCPLKKDQKITGSLLLHPAVLESRHRADQFRRRNPQL